MDGLANDILTEARNLVTLWKNQKITSLPRQERNAAIDETRNRLIKAVEAYEPYF